MKNVVEYTCDAWGKPLTKTGTLATTLGTLNPFRYRGYVCDEETGLYYLRSRYYNPVWGRFLNADNQLGKPGQLFGHNLFTYCRNNPVTLADPSGNIAANPSAKPHITDGHRAGTLIAILLGLILSMSLSHPETSSLERTRANNNPTYYYVTSAENAESIIVSKMLIGSSFSTIAPFCTSNTCFEEWTTYPYIFDMN